MAPLDLLVVGSGVAGLSAAVRAAGEPGLRVGVVTKADLDQATTRWAQGGVAAVLGGDPDSTDLHLADTLAAGAGLCDRDAVEVLVNDGPGRVTELIALGAAFDTDEVGNLLLAREGGHSMARIVHAGGAATGVEVERALVQAVRSTAAVVWEGWFALDLIVEGGVCKGVAALDTHGHAQRIEAAHVLLASGGAGQVYRVTTNPGEATGDGIAMALRAGVPVADVEFVQFHPTALHHPRMPKPLLSEALRGHGALLRDLDGERFIDELQPRDVVTRAMAARMAATEADHLWLDAAGIEHFAERFPTIARALADVGLDPAVDWLPIAPAAHYLCGGVVTDLSGATTLPGLWACGEVACTGVHGANRLASNSLLEGMVFAPRTVEAILVGHTGPSPTGAMRAILEPTKSGADPSEFAVVPSRMIGRIEPRVPSSGIDIDAGRLALQRSMSRHAGVVRSAESLHAAHADLDAIAAAVSPVLRREAVRGGRSEAELANLATLAAAIVTAAEIRAETRGGHTRSDHPEQDRAMWCRLVHA